MEVALKLETMMKSRSPEGIDDLITDLEIRFSDLKTAVEYELNLTDKEEKS